MEFAAAAVTAVAGAIGSAATAVSGAVGSVGTALGISGSGAIGAGSLITGLLSGTATVAGMLGAQASSEEQARGLRAQAADARTEQDVERLRGDERRDSLRRSLLTTLGERDVAAAASGIDLSFGTAAQARDEAQRDADQALGMDQATEDFRVARLQERGNEFLRSARSARKAGVIKSVGLGLQGAASIAKRG